VGVVTSSAAQDASAAYGPVGRSPWLDVDWRAHQRWVVVGDRPVNVVELGHGPPLLFVHGLAGSWPNWLEQLPVFAGDPPDGRSAGRSSIGGHRVIALDLPGFGHSPMPVEPISIAAYARTLDALLDALEVDAAAVVGHSMGGFAAAELAIAFPRRVERLVLVSPAGLSTYRDPRGLRELRRIRRVQRPVAAITSWGAAHADFLARRPALRDVAIGSITRHAQRLPAPLVAEQIRGGGGKPGFVQGLRANLDYDLRHRLPEIACPTLIVWGASDRVVTVRDADAYAELIPNSRRVVLPDTGHFLQVERPAAFNALLEEFLEE
jgi:pimeloyl-ACP methyl ester carboxylesterase